MGAERPAALNRELPGYASAAVDVAELLPGVEWPAQVEVRAGRHVVRPRYEVTQGGRTRIAHLNVERADLKPNPEIKSLHNLLGRGYLLPFPVLPPNRFRSIVLPTPMAERQANLPLRLDVFGTDGRKTAERFLGNLPRDHALAVDLGRAWRGRGGTRSWFTTSATAAMRMVGCIAWSATSTRRAGMRRRAVSARTSTTRR